MEVAIYDKSGKPHAYIAYEDDKTIYLWGGKPVAYLDGEHVFGFNGKHLGWFDNGIMYDGQGERVGFTKQTCPSVTQVEQVKSVKHVKHVKSVQQVAPRKLIFSLGYSTLDLSVLLEGGY